MGFYLFYQFSREWHLEFPIVERYATSEKIAFALSCRSFVEACLQESHDLSWFVVEIWPGTKESFYLMSFGFGVTTCKPQLGLFVLQDRNGSLKILSRLWFGYNNKTPPICQAVTRHVSCARWSSPSVSTLVSPVGEKAGVVEHMRACGILVLDVLAAVKDAANDVCGPMSVYWCNPVR